MSSENLNQLIDALTKYQNTTNLEILRNLTPEERRSLKYDDPSSSTEADLSYELYDFERSEAALIKAIDNYIDDRIKLLTKSID